MGGVINLKLDPERVREMPMVDLAFEALKSMNSPMYYRDLIMEIAKIRGLSAEQLNDVIAQVYTEINIDGRFACVGSNMWGLKRWYPVDKSEDPVGNAKRPRIINDDDDDDEEMFADDEEETYVADEEDYDMYDEDREDFGDSEEDAEVDEEVAIDDEEIEEEALDGEGLAEEADGEAGEFDESVDDDDNEEER